MQIFTPDELELASDHMMDGSTVGAEFVTLFRCFTDETPPPGGGLALNLYFMSE